eukprot:CAMPEP_0168315646 /NCGR_PEP_ID=MMETSP0210-20121227/12112_1 /TAXON_ID=40633 /ORGANISM="Condylostoma magnum, Strain COL2" /LENGTH=96 /DNA_ID=CAMNT_0008290337 /DNA_START=845 /DNA_END=1132 /DNA_ORIENTATION=+
MIQETAAVVNDEVIDNVFNTCWGSFEDMEEVVEEMILDGLSPDALINQFFDTILQNDLSDLKKAKICCTLAEVDHMLITGADERFCLVKAFTTAQE